MAKRSNPPEAPSPELPEFTWDIQHQGAREVFCAALTGILANPITPSWGTPDEAVEMANQVVEAMQRRGKVKI